MEKIKFTLTDRFGALIIAPIGVDEMVITYERSDDDSKRDYTKDMPSSLTLKGEAYKRLMRIEKSIYRCTEQYIVLERQCVNANNEVYYKEIFSGFISLNKAEINLDFCEIVVTFDENTPYKCLEENAREKYNMLNVQTKVDVNLLRPGVKLERLTCYAYSLTEPKWCGTEASPDTGLWSILNSYTKYTDSPTGERQAEFMIEYCREYIEVNCNENPGEGWTINGVCAGGKQKYIRYATITECKYTDTSEGNVIEFTQTCKALVNSNTKIIPNGRKLGDVLKYIVTDHCGLNIKSDFFQINPTVSTNVNYVTGQRSFTDNIILFQKSDVKRPEAINKATIGDITFEELTEFLKIAFNVEYRIDGNNLLFEHVSYFNKNLGFDLTQQKYNRYTQDTRNYSYDSQEIPILERWKMKEQSTGDFGDAVINYSGACVTNKKKNEKEYTINDFTTDLEYVLSHPNTDDANVEDTGFVVLSTSFDGSSYYVNSAKTITYGNKLNNVFSNMQLVRDYNFYERPLLYGKFNRQDVTFKSSLPIKKGASIEIPYTCSDEFKPDNYVKTNLGNGIVDKAEYNVYNGTIKLDLLYQSDSGLEQNDRPTVTSYSKTTYINIPIEIDLFLNAHDPQGDETLVGYRIKRHPTKGVLTEVNNHTVLYTPNQVGQDNFLFVVYDEWSEESVLATCSIVVRPENQPPVANDNYYEVYSDVDLNVNAANGLFSNDNDDNGFTLFDYDRVSNFGAIVNVNANGSFTYKTVPGIYGVDYFGYTIVDDTGLKASARAYITVKDRNQVVTMPDKYFTSRNNAFTANGTEPNKRLIENDISPSGATITALVENKTTSRGSNVSITADGSFTYTPLNNLIGADTFTYTAIAGTSQAIGNVTVNIVNSLYVKLLTENHHTENIIRKCNGTDTIVGTRTRADINLYFYSDAAKTIPYDVTNLGLKVRVNEQSINFGVPYNREFYTNEVSGIKHVLYQQLSINTFERDCDQNDLIDNQLIISLLSGQGYLI